MVFYDETLNKYYAYNSKTQKKIVVAKDIKFTLYDEDNDVPDDPNEEIILEKDLNQGCTTILKSGPNKGKQCCCKTVNDVGICKRHNYCSIQLIL